MSSQDNLSKTVLNEVHRAHGATMVDFGGWDMPVRYPEGDITAHLATRKNAGLFDVSHMGRFLFSGNGAVPLLQHALTNNAYALLEPGMAQYSIIQGHDGTAVDDAYLYRIGPDKHLLVVNASNRIKDWNHLSAFFSHFGVTTARDISEEMAMLSLQGPKSEMILEEILSERNNSGKLPENKKNRISSVKLSGEESHLSRTGYTGEPVGFEIFLPSNIAVGFWEHILEVGEKHGVLPIGLGVRDTLRLEAAYPLYGHELGLDTSKTPIPLLALPLGRAATRFDDGKGDYLGKRILLQQYDEVSEVLRRNGAYDRKPEDRLVKKLVWPLAVLNKDGNGPDNNPIRGGMEVYKDGKLIGWVTSGTVVPYWKFEGEGFLSRISQESGKRAIGIAYVNSDVHPGDLGIHVDVKKGNGFVPAMLVKDNLRAAPPYARHVLHPER